MNETPDGNHGRDLRPPEGVPAEATAGIPVPDASPGRAPRVETAPIDAVTAAVPAPGADPAPTMPPPPDRYSPAPEPRTDWSRPEFASDRPVWPAQPERTAPVWSEPASAERAGPAARDAPAEPPRRGSGVAGPILAASLISAVLASGGTYLMLSATGALDRPAAAVVLAGRRAGEQPAPVTIDESSATIDVAAKVGPAVVQITTEAAAAVTDPLRRSPRRASARASSTTRTAGS